MPEECIRILESKVQKEEAAMKQAQPLGEKMDQARARFRRAVEAGEKAMQALQKAHANFEKAQQEVIQAQMDLDKFMQEAPLPVMPVPQVNVSLVKSLEALTKNYRKHVESRCRATTISPHTRNPGVEGNLSDLIGDRVSGGERSFGCPVGSRTGSRALSKPSRWRMKKRTLQAGRLWKRRGHAKPRQTAHR